MKINKFEYLGWAFFVISFILAIISSYNYNSYYKHSSKVSRGLNIVEYNQKGEIIFLQKSKIWF